MRKRILLIIFFIILLVCVDQVSKIMIANNLNLYSSISIIPNFFNLTYSINYGAAFGILQGKICLFLILTVGVLIYLFFELKNEINSKYNFLFLTLIIAGIIGNFIDRLYFGYVRDFLSFKIINYEAPIFNLADSFIVIGIILLLISIFKESRGKKCK